MPPLVGHQVVIAQNRQCAGKRTGGLSLFGLLAVIVTHRAFLQHDENGRRGTQVMFTIFFHDLVIVALAGFEFGDRGSFKFILRCIADGPRSRCATVRIEAGQ